MTDTISPAVAAKAASIVADGLVAHGPGRRGLDYRVKGTTGFYTVTIYGQTAERLDGTCTCPHRGRLCSHIVAAAQWGTLQGDTLGGEPTPADDRDPFDIR